MPSTNHKGTHLDITIVGDIPSKKNSKIIVCRGARPMLLSSKRHQEWEEAALSQLKMCVSRFDLDDPPRLIEITVYPSTKRAGDLTNKAESIMDVLVKNGTIEDDNWFIVSRIILTFGGVDKKNPRAEISVYWDV